MAKHQKRFLDIFLDNSSGLSNAVEVVTSLLSMAFLKLKEVSAPDDISLARARLSERESGTLQ